MQFYCEFVVKYFVIIDYFFLYKKVIEPKKRIKYAQESRMNIPLPLVDTFPKIIDKFMRPHKYIAYNLDLSKMLDLGLHIFLAVFLSLAFYCFLIQGISIPLDENFWCHFQLLFILGFAKVEKGKGLFVHIHCQGERIF